MKIQKSLFAATGLLFAASTMQATVITVNLGQSAQNFVMTGLGALGNGNGSYSIQQGACTNAAGETTCTMSGTIASGGSPGFTSGTYSFVTTYLTSDVLPVQGESETPTSDLFYYDYLAPDVSMVLTVNAPGGDYVESMVADGNFVTGTSFGFSYTGTEVCTGVGSCSQANVGQVNGATISGPVTIGATFTIPNTATPEPASLALAGMSAMLFEAFRLRRKHTA